MFIYIYRKLKIIGYSVVLIAIARVPLALAAGPPQDVNPTVWCAQHTEADICQEPECD
jgi:hypothetical protein